jgi:hypothetical protein
VDPGFGAGRPPVDPGYGRPGYGEAILILDYPEVVIQWTARTS